MNRSTTSTVARQLRNTLPLCIVACEIYNASPGLGGDHEYAWVVIEAKKHSYLFCYGETHCVSLPTSLNYLAISRYFQPEPFPKFVAIGLKQSSYSEEGRVENVELRHFDKGGLS